MSDPTLESLFWEEVDGPPSAERRRRIEVMVEERPELEGELDELRGLAASLEEVTEEPPPPELWAGVRRAIAGRPAQRGSRGIGGWLRSLGGSGWRPRLAFATIALVAGVVALHLVTGWPSSIGDADRSRLAGALNVGEHGDAEPLELALAHAAGTLSFFRQGAIVTTRLSPASDTPLRLTLAADNPLELVRAAGARPPRHEVVSGSGRVEVIAEGPLQLDLQLGGKQLGGASAVLEVRVATVAGESLLDRRVDLSRTVER